MRLGWRAFERAARRRLQALLRPSKEKWKEYKRVRRRVWGEPVGFLYLFWLPAALINVAISRGSKLIPELWPLALVFYATGTVFFRAQSLYGTLYHSYELAAFLHLPASDRDFFRFAWNRTVLRSLWFLGICLAAYAWVWLGIGGVSLYRVFLVSLVALLQWLTMLLLVLVAFHYGRARAGLWALVFNGLAFVIALFTPQWALVFKPVAWVLPAGWITHAAVASLEPGSPVAIVLILAGLGLSMAVVRLAESVSSRYPEAELELPSLGEFATEGYETEGAETLGPPLTPEHSEARERWAATRLVEGAAQGDLLAPFDWEGQGWIERLVARGLSLRQRAVMEFLLGGESGWWTWRWRKAAWIASLGLLATLVLPFLPLWLVPLPLIVATLTAIPLLGGRWPAFEARYVWGTTTPVYSVYPLTFWELSLTMLKANMLRLAAWLPLWVAYAGGLCWRWSVPLHQGLTLAAAAAFIAAAAQPLLIAARFSQGTNDSLQINRTSVALWVVGLVAGPAFVVGAIALFFVPYPVQLLLCGALLPISLGSWGFYGWLYTRGKIDVVRPPPNAWGV